MSAISLEKHHQAAKQLPKSRLIIGEKLLAQGSGGIYMHINPSTGEQQAEIPLAGQSEVDQAVLAARKGANIWRRTRPYIRMQILKKFADLVRNDIERLAVISALENGLSKEEIIRHQSQRILGWLEYYAGWADKIEGQVICAPPSEHLEYTIPEPYGVIGIIITWNAPLISLAMKVQPALAAGNAVVIKPAEFTPFTSMRFVELALEAGIPPGVINLVTGGTEAGSALASHPGIDKLSFTGGPIAARQIMKSAAENLTPLLFELGGKSANLIFEDANQDYAAIYSSMFPLNCAGQGCALPTRLLVQESIYDRFVDRVIESVSQLPVGDPLDPITHYGPVVNAAACQRILGRIKEAVDSKSGTLAYGGTRMDGDFANGYFIKPTVFTNVVLNSRLAQEEVFGPVLAISKFKDEEEALAIANGTAYGLAAYVQTESLSRAHRLASELRAGAIHINGAPNIVPGAPFGGIGLSGFGKEGGKPGLDEFLRLKDVGIGPPI